jgi:hypothetical protein
MLLIEKKYFDGLIDDLEDKITNDYYIYNSNAYWDAVKKLQAYRFVRHSCSDLSGVVGRLKLCYNILFKKIKK